MQQAGFTLFEGIRNRVKSKIEWNNCVEIYIWLSPGEVGYFWFHVNFENEVPITFSDICVYMSVKFLNALEYFSLF